MERQTVQKDLVYSALVALHNHPTADQVFDRVHLSHPHVSKATVYRILRSMAACGEILHIPVANGADRFDHTREGHFHILCTACGRVADIFDSQLDEGIRAAGAASDFQLRGYELLFRGLCPDCLKETACP